MRPIILGLAASLLAAGGAMAQTTGATNPGTMTPTPTMTPGTPGAAPATTGMSAATSNPASAAGNDNQAVATTNANAMTPARGHNSFSRGEARRRIQSQGFAGVTGLHKDTTGVWRGMGTKDGKSVGVWLDYKGNVGASAT